MGAQGLVLRALLDGDTLFRVLLRSGELTDPRTAFFIRNTERDTGLSVNYDLTPEECRSQDCFEKTYGVRSMVLELVRHLELEVVPDDLHHANITGIPHSDDDAARAEFLAGELLKISTLIYSGLRKNP